MAIYAQFSSCFLSCLRMVIMCHSDEAELCYMVATAALMMTGMREIIRGEALGIPDGVKCYRKGRIIRNSDDLAILRSN